MRQQVVVVSGGASSEHDVSVASGTDVSAALARNPRYSVVDVYIDRTGAWHPGGQGRPPLEMADVLDEIGPGTVVFPVLHGGWGEGGGLQRELEERAIPFIGSGADASACALSKADTLRACAGAGIGVIPTLIIHRGRYVADPDLVTGAIRRAFDERLVLKPDTGGSSIGVHIVEPTSVRGALDDVFTHDRVALAQPVVMGQEVSVGVWTRDGAPQATGASLLRLPTGADGDGFTYAHKYEGAGAVLEIPGSFPEDVLAGLRDAALRCFAALGCRGLARVDFFVDRDGRILLNEINTIPGLRRESHFPRLVAATGNSYDVLLEHLVESAAGASPLFTSRSLVATHRAGR